MQVYLAIGGFLVVVLVTGVIGLAIVARRLGSLISLHHHLAGGANNSDGPKRGTFRKSRRISVERQNRQQDNLKK
jgi:hypothetical protein